MSWDQPIEFAEGDSGVPMQPPAGHFIKIWNDIESGKQREADKPTEYCSLDAVTALADIIGAANSIANDKSNDPLARAKALEVKRKAIMDQIYLDTLDGR